MTRLVRWLFVAAAIFLVLAAVGIAFSIHQYMEPLRTHQAALIGALVEEYPDAEQELIHLLSGADDATIRRGEAILARYGYDSDALLLATDLMQSQLRIQTWLYLSLVVFVTASLAAIFLLFIRRRYQTIRQLQQYIDHIADGRETLDIRDNEEGDFSLLKNRIYTITTMLGEQTDALRREKLTLSDSIADISHQLKTPLTSLSVMTDLLMDDPPPEMRREFLNRIRAQLDRLEWLVASLLKLAKLDAGTVQMKQQPVQVNHLVQRTLDTLRMPLEDKQHLVELDGEPGVEFAGDLEWTTEALINILKNCIEHTPPQGRIRIAWETNPIYTRIQVADNGIGIESKDLPYIFQRFYKGSHAGDDSIGIGLAMAQTIVKQQNGEITASSEPGVGTTFTITFYKVHI